MSYPTPRVPGTLFPHLASGSDVSVPTTPALPWEGRASVVDVEDKPAETRAQPRPAVLSPARVGRSWGSHEATGTVPGPVLALVLVLAGLVGVLLLIPAVVLQRRTAVAGTPWRTGLIVLLCVRFAGIVLAMGVGLWWWWRAPANPTGRLLYLAGVCDCIFMIGAGFGLCAVGR